MSVIHVDRPACEGIGMCEAQADDYFRVGDDGLVEVVQPEVAAADHAHVAAAVDSCPMSALRLAK